MKRLLIAGALAAALVSVPVRAQAAPSQYVFVAVDALDVQPSKFVVTGVLDGESAARTVTVNFSTAYAEQVVMCERLALLAMTRPGQFRLEIETNSTSYYACRLARVTP